MKTAKILIKDENLYLSTRYKLARVYCLEDGSSKIWNNMSRDLKKSFLDTVFNFIVNRSRGQRGGLISAYVSDKDSFCKKFKLG